ncbi:MAG: HDOD domain-containing protein [Deltaproteobacteria bacterium]|nr:HDOD domain-containing protein [Deltaproteobacteria bacterium]
MSKVKATSNYGKGEASIIEELFENSQAHKKELELSENINKIISSDTFKPPLLPEVAISLTNLANQPNVSMSKVEDVAKGDPAVAGRIVAIANSALYSRGAPVRSLSMAISRLGLATVRDIAFEVVAQTTIFKVPGYMERMRELYDAARLSGHISKHICLELKFESEMAYLCGLLHDMGEAIILGIIGQISKNDKSASTDEETLSIVIKNSTLK